MKLIGIALGLLVIGFLLWLCLWVPLFGFNYETARGEHTGYVTAVERSGIFFKTGTAYLKTDTQSSQEDSYCFIDKEVESQLQQHSLKKTHVNVYFYSLLSAGIANCAGEGAIIYRIEPLVP